MINTAFSIKIQTLLHLTHHAITSDVVVAAAAAAACFSYIAAAVPPASSFEIHRRGIARETNKTKRTLR
jgi:hypothetical protein